MKFSGDEHEKFVFVNLPNFNGIWYGNKGKYDNTDANITLQLKSHISI